MNKTTPTTITTSLPEIRALALLASRACCALTPLASDGKGFDHHGGQLHDPAGVIHRALADLVDAGALAAHLRHQAMGSSEGAGK